MLDGVGVTPDQEQAYRALIERPGADAAELAAQTHLDEHRLTDVLTALQAHGLISSTAESPPRYIPAPPRLAVEALAAARQDRIERARLEAARMMERYRERPSSLNTAAMVEVIQSREAARHRYNQLKRQVQHELCGLDKGPYLVPYAEDMDQMALLDSGVAIRGVYQRSVLDDPGHVEHLRRHQLHGEESRVVPELPLKLVIADRSVALLPLTMGDGGDHQTWALVHPSELLDGLLGLFDLLWHRAVPLQVATTGDSGKEDISAADLQLLGLMLAGLQDQAIARQMDITPRTVARRVARLMTLSEADTRFQLGWRAVQKGWL